MLCFGAKLQKMESLYLGFWVFNFDTVKQILFTKMPKNLVVSHF